MERGIRWHDGEILDADDVCFTVEALLSPANPSPLRPQLQPYLAGCEVERDQAVIQLVAPHHHPLHLLDFAVLPQHVFDSTTIPPDHPFASAPIGTGPLRVEQWSPTALELRAPARSRRAPPLRRVSVRGPGDPEADVQLLLDGLVDGIVDIRPDLRARLADHDEVGLQSYDTHTWWFAALDTHHGPLRHVEVRHALEAALDREALRERTLGRHTDGPSSPMTFISGPFVPASPSSDRTLAPRPSADLVAVETHLVSAGAHRVGEQWHLADQAIALEIGLLHDYSTQLPGLLPELVAQLEVAGLQATARVLGPEQSAAALRGELAGELDILVGGWSRGLLEDVAPVFGSRIDDRGQHNVFAFSDAETDRLLAAHARARTAEEAREAAHALQRHLSEVRPSLFLWTLDTKSAWSLDLRGNAIAPTYYFQDFDRWTW